MSAATGVDYIKTRIGQLRAEADINDTEVRRLHVEADNLEQHVKDDRRVADELEALLPTEVES